MRINNIQFRQMGSGRNPEIVQWNKNADGTEYCFTLLWWTRDKEGYQIEFIGPRPFEHEDEHKLWSLMRYGQTVLDAQFKLEEA